MLLRVAIHLCRRVSLARPRQQQVMVAGGLTNAHCRQGKQTVAFRAAAIERMTNGTQAG